MPLESFFDNMQSAKPTKPSKTKFDHRSKKVINWMNYNFGVV